MNTWITYQQNHESHPVVNHESVVLILRAANVAVPALETLLKDLDCYIEYLKDVSLRQHSLHIL